jgi:palmitoyl-protein thioesterase
MSAQNNSYKDGITRLRKLVLIGGPDDGVITPWQSR